MVANYLKIVVLAISVICFAAVLLYQIRTGSEIEERLDPPGGDTAESLQEASKRLRAKPQ
jgi:hypothetical protein